MRGARRLSCTTDAARLASRYADSSAAQLALYLRRIRLTRSVLTLKALADEIEQQYPTDEATPRLLDVIAVKVARLATSN